MAGDYTATKWTTREGLPSDSVTAVLRARDGYLWVGTTDGLARFDGARFLPLTLEPRTGSTNLSITALCEDDSGQVWIGTQADGLFCAAHETLRRFGAAEGLADPTVTCLATAPRGGLWIGTKAGLHRLNQGRISRLTKSDGLPSDFILSVQVADSGTVWITTREGVCRFLDERITASELQENLPGRTDDCIGAYENHHGELWAYGDSFLMNLTQSKRFNHFRAGAPVATRVWTLHEARDGALWIGTSGRGLLRFKEGRFDPINLPDERMARDVRAITTDDEANVWLGTHDDGLVRLRQAQLRWLDLKTKTPGAVNALAEDSRGWLWASVNGDGLQVIRGGHSEPVDVPGLSGLRHVLALCVGARDALWFGTWGAGVYRLDASGVVQFTLRDGLSDDVVSAVCAARGAYAFIGTRSGDVHHFFLRGWERWGDRTLPRGITALLHGADQTLWVGTDGAGLWRIANEKAAPECTPAALSNTVIRALAEDSHGRIWVGTAAHGLACVKGQEVRVATINNGLPHNAVSQILMDAQENLWLGTDRGIYKVTREAANAFAAGEPLALPRPVGQDEPAADLRCLPGQPGAVRTRDGMLWFATMSGVAGIKPDTIRTDPTSPPVYIEEILVNGQPVRSPWAKADTLSSLQLPYPLRSLEIHFTALGLHAPESLKFRHKLEGFDAEWDDEGAGRLVHYGSLPSGAYRFRVMATETAGAWNGPAAELNVIVATPFWRTWWFLAVAGLSTLGSVAAGVRQLSHRRLRLRLRHLQDEQAMERERTRIARDMHDELGAKLTKVSFLGERLKSRVANAPELRAQVDSIAETTRSLLKSLDEIVWAVNPKNDSLRHLADYLGQYAGEYFEDTSVECAVALLDELPEMPLSAERRHNLFLSFEEALNNVLKHSEATRLQVTMTLAGDTFKIVIEDNGCGFEKVGQKDASTGQPKAEMHGRGGNGLVNMQARLAEVGGRCRVTSVPGRGTQVELQLPVHNHSTLS